MKMKTSRLYSTHSHALYATLYSLSKIHVESGVPKT